MAKPHTIRIPDSLWQAFNHLWAKGQDGPLGDYESVAAAFVGMTAWTLYHQKKHVLSPDIQKLRWADRTLVYNFMAYAAMHDMYLPDMTPRPVQATDLLALAKKWWAGDPE